MNKNNKNGFTLIEIMVSSALFVLVLLIVTSTYSVGQRIYRQSINDNELWQNARVVLDRTSREIRQAKKILTVLPATNNNSPSEIIFEDGHDTVKISYIRYYLNGTDVYRETYHYYFDSEPNTYVPWNSVDNFGNTPIKAIEENYIVGQFFSNLNFWGSNKLVNIEATLEKNSRIINLMTAVFGRNL